MGPQACERAAESLPDPLPSPSTKRVQANAGAPRAQRTREDHARDAEVPLVRSKPADDGRSFLGDDARGSKRHVRPGFGEMAEEGVRFHGPGI